MLKNSTTEMNPEILLLVNPYEVNPGNSRVQSYHSSSTSTSRTSPSLVKIDSGDHNSCEFQEVPSKKVKVEMEEFSDLGDLLPSIKGRFAMGELDLPTMEPEGLNDFNIWSYQSSNLGDFVDTQDFRKNDNQLYIDNQKTNIEDIMEDQFCVFQKELPSGYELNYYNTTRNNNLINKAPSNIFDFEDARMASHIIDHQYSNVSSPSNGSSTPQYSPVDISNSASSYDENQTLLRQKLSDFNLDLKFFVSDNLNTPDILESVVSLEDERFNFLNRLDSKKLQTINEADLKFQLPLLPEAKSDEVKSIDTVTNSEQVKKQSNKRKKYDDDEDYIPPTTSIRTRTTNCRARLTESDSENTESESEEEYIPTKKRNTLKGRRRVSSVSSTSSKCSSEVSKYRELRDKNNEASRKSRQKRKAKEHDLEKEGQELEMRNVKLKAEVEELQRMVDNLRSNLFQIVLKK